MCNIILITKPTCSNNNVPIETVQRILPYLKTRGRDKYTFYTPDTNELFTTVFFNQLEKKVQEYSSVTSILLHSRAAPETEVHTLDIPTIYTDNTIYVTHHGTIPDAEKVDSSIQVDSQLLISIYKTFDYSNPYEWFIRSLEQFPRSTTEVAYDSRTKKYIIATNFMPLYYFVSDDIVVYSTYKISDEYFLVNPYSIHVI